MRNRGILPDRIAGRQRSAQRFVRRDCLLHEAYRRDLIGGLTIQNLARANGESLPQEREEHQNAGDPESRRTPCPSRRQHADRLHQRPRCCNGIDWREWQEEALQRQAHGERSGVQRNPHE